MAWPREGDELRVMQSLLRQGILLQDRYRILRPLGQGGMGAVYLARDRRLDKLCAVKETLDVSPQAQQQFSREARLLARLDHPHLPRVTDYFGQTGRYYLVMDYVEGQDLDAWVRARGPVPLRQALAWADQVLDALGYLHGQSPAVIHRDVKPANVKVTPEGKAFLVDFGIAKEYRPGQHTVTGARALTPGFAPLEQYAARGQTDARTDVYGLGATLYFLLTGVEPPGAVDRAAGRRLPAPSALNPSLRAVPGVDGVVTQALALQKDDRWATAREMRRVLRRVAGQIAAQARSAARSGTASGRSAPGQLDTRPVRTGTSAGLDQRVLLLGLGALAVLLLIVLGLLALSLAGEGGRLAMTAGGTSTLAPTWTEPAVAALAATPSLLRTATRPVAALPSRPTATVEARLALTPTLVLTSTPEPSPTATAQSTSRPRVTATQPVTPTPYPPPALVAPEAGASLGGEVDFEWRWDYGPLGEDLFFDLRIGLAEEASTGVEPLGVMAPTKALEGRLNLENVVTIQNNQGRTDRFYWTVVVVRVVCEGCTPQIVGRWGEKRAFIYAEPSAPGGPGPPPQPPPTRESPAPTPTRE